MSLPPPVLTRRTVLVGIAGAIGSFLPAQMGGAATMPHAILLGDSTLDNAAYVPPAQDVTEQLRAALPRGWRSTLMARDGDVIAGVQRQLQDLPQDASHLIVSVGGNDALRESGVLSAGARSVADALDRLATVRERFAAEYRAMLDHVGSLNLPTAICTIYEAAFPDPASRRIASTALAVLNDVITREASSRGLPLIDLRVIFSEAADYANAIEPSAAGGRKFAAAITAVVTEHDFARRRSAVFLGPV